MPDTPSPRPALDGGTGLPAGPDVARGPRDAGYPGVVPANAALDLRPAGASGTDPVGAQSLWIAQRLRIVVHPPAIRARMAAWERMPFWKHFSSNFSFGEWIRSSSSPKPTRIESKPRICWM